MSKKVLVIAGVLVAAGTAAALAAPHFRGHHRMGFDRGERWGGPRLAERLKEMDTNKDGTITLDEFLARPDGRFARMDKNGDGFIDASDIAAMAKERVDYRIKRFLKDFDTNRDGKVTKEEFSARAKERFAMRDLDSDGIIGPEDLPPGVREHAMRRKEAREKEGAKEGTKEAGKERGWFSLERLMGRSDKRFARLDKNGDGVIDAADFEAASAERLAYDTKRMMKRFDTDGDGKISKAEFERFAKERFARLDLDDDGKITEMDLPPGMRGRGILK